jgi:hypothetical protein
MFLDNKAHNVSKSVVGNEKIIISFTVHPKDFKLISYQADAWGINSKKFVGATITFFTMPGQEEKHPKCEVYQCGDISNPYSAYSNKQKFPLYWTIADRILFGFFASPWWPFSEVFPFQSSNLIRFKRRNQKI